MLIVHFFLIKESILLFSNEQLPMNNEQVTFKYLSFPGFQTACNLEPEASATG